MAATAKCVCCGMKMNNIATLGYQPIGGLAFSTRGHYGSRYFDPMDGSYLELAVCDECVAEAARKRRVFRGKPNPRYAEVG